MLSEDMVFFWFFDFVNLELFVKVFDGCFVNGYYWVFFGFLSDFDYIVIIIDW